MNCASSEECPQNEGCFTSSESVNVCVSCAAAPMVGLQPVDSICAESDTSPDTSVLEEQPIGSRLTGEHCPNGVSDCGGDRVCMALEDENYEADALMMCESGGDSCFCRPLNMQQCIDSSNCVAGEMCYEFRENVFKACQSCIFSDHSNDAEGESCSDGSGSPSEQIFDNMFTGDHCLDGDRNCAGDRRCAKMSEVEFSACALGGQGCICRFQEFEKCSSTRTCSSGDRCVFTNESREETVCISCRIEIDEMEMDGASEVETGICEGIEASPTGEASDACIATGMLDNYSSMDLVFETSRRASVLCDVEGSCATPGHFVVYNGMAMSMSKYCRTRGDCFRRVMFVNSPRMRAGLRVSSKTDGLQFTALAAQYGTNLEEWVLRMLVGIGI